MINNANYSKIWYNANGVENGQLVLRDEWQSAGRSVAIGHVGLLFIWKPKSAYGDNLGLDLLECGLVVFDISSMVNSSCVFILDFETVVQWDHSIIRHVPIKLIFMQHCFHAGETHFAMTTRAISLGTKKTVKRQFTPVKMVTENRMKVEIRWIKCATEAASHFMSTVWPASLRSKWIPNPTVENLSAIPNELFDPPSGILLRTTGITFISNSLPYLQCDR